MIAVSTFRPHEGEPEYAQNQIRGVKSWVPFFASIVLLCEHEEPDLAFSNVVFVPGFKRPKIKEMIEFLAHVKPWGAWINADIVLMPGFQYIQPDMEAHKCTAGTSFRYTFDPKRPDLAPVKEPNDWGLDLFVCAPKVWEDMLKHIDPRWMKCGMVYDSWMSGFLNKRHRLVDFTNRGLVFHPKHGGRVTDGFNDPKWAEGEFAAFAGPPRFKLPRRNMRARV